MGGGTSLVDVIETNIDDLQGVFELGDVEINNKYLFIMTCSESMIETRAGSVLANDIIFPGNSVNGFEKFAPIIDFWSACLNTSLSQETDILWNKTQNILTLNLSNFNYVLNMNKAYLIVFK